MCNDVIISLLFVSPDISQIIVSKLFAHSSCMILRRETFPKSRLSKHDLRSVCLTVRSRLCTKRFFELSSGENDFGSREPAGEEKQPPSSVIA